MAVTVASSNPSIPFDPLVCPDDPVQFPAFEAILEESSFGFESGPKGRFWQGRGLASGLSMEAMGRAGPDGYRSILLRLRGISSYRASRLPYGGAGAGALPERYRCLDRSPERDVLPQGTWVIRLADGPLRLSRRGRS